VVEFFQVVGGFDQVGLTDLLLRRYHNMDFVLSLPFGEFCDLVIHASKSVEEDRIRNQWNALLPFMAIKWLKWMPFEEYADGCTGRNIDTRPKDEIIDEILKLHGMESLEDGNI